MKRGKYKRTQKYKMKMSEIMKIIKRTPKAREQSRLGAFKYWRETPLSKSEISKKHSEAMFHYLQKLKDEGKPVYWLGKKRSHSDREKMSLAHRGKKLSEKHRNKISLAKRGSKNPAWKGGKKIISTNYIYILKPHHPFANNKGYVFEHRLVIENILDRFLKLNEFVHHCNKNKKDNMPKNLIVFGSHKDHVHFEHGRFIPSERIIFDGRNYS